MLTVSLHGIRLHAKVGLYPEEKVKGNDFEIDVDVNIDISDSKDDLPFIDYSIIHSVVMNAFQQPGELLETFVKKIHQEIKEKIGHQGKVKVAIRKLQPPLQGEIDYAQVSFEA